MSAALGCLGLCCVESCALGCVPEGPPSGEAPVRPAPAGSVRIVHPLAASPALGTVFADDFERSTLGPDWQALSDVWRIEAGELCGRGAKNRGAWLRRSLPANVRIEIDARSDSADGDIKLELFGDGASGATAASYDDATSYVAIFGGWQNRRHVLARLDEHGEDRLALEIDPGAVDDPRVKPVAQGQRYAFVFERKDGRTLRWSIDGETYFELEDEDPLAGPGHDHFGVNDWMAPVCFDNLRITPMDR